MHCLYFHQHFSTRSGSAGTRSYEMAQQLIRRGHQVTMVCGSADGGETGLDGPFRRGMRRGIVDGIDVVELQLTYSNSQGLLRRSLTFGRFALSSVRIVLTERSDLVFATSTPLTAAIPGIVSRLLKRRKPFVFEVRDLWPELPRAMGVVTSPLILWAMGMLESAAYRAASTCIGLSPGICEGIRRKVGDTKPVVMIPNGCDLELFRVRNGTTAGPFRAIYCGTHGIANGLDAVLDAAGQLLKQDSEIEIHLIGNGKEKPRLMQRAIDEELRNVQFHASIPHYQLAHQLADYSLGLMILDDVPAFYYGTSPNKFFDYLSAGIPVLTNYPGWVAELLEKSDCGVAVPPGDATTFADRLVELAADPEQCRAKGHAARELARSTFSRDDLSTQFVDTLEAQFGSR